MTRPLVPRVAISASIAYDHIMAFGGSFADHIIPEKTHVISVSFLVDTLRKQRGGVGGNIAYNLALLGEPSFLIGAVGYDFGPYRTTFEELGIDMSGIIEVADELSASAFMMADQKDNQIASFFPGPSHLSAGIDVSPFTGVEFAIVGATDPQAMRIHADAFGNGVSKLLFDPAFQIILLSGDDLESAIEHSWGIVGNDYEFAMLEKKTALSIDSLSDRLPFVCVTFGEQGAELRQDGRVVRVPAAPARQVKDPTGAGDAFRAGLLKGLLLQKPLEVTGRLACLTAVYAVEHVGTQEHAYTTIEFIDRFDQSYPDYAGAIQEPEINQQFAHQLTGYSLN